MLIECLTTAFGLQASHLVLFFINFFTIMRMY